MLVCFAVVQEISVSLMLTFENGSVFVDQAATKKIKEDNEQTVRQKKKIK